MWDKGRPLPKFGDWDVNDPASAEGYTVIFNKARDEKLRLKVGFAAYKVLLRNHSNGCSCVYG